MDYYSKYFSKLEYYLHQYLSLYFGQYEIMRRTRPDWLYDASGRRLELDFYIEAIHIAIEVQGMQHYEYNPHFHGDYDGFKDQQERDELKRAACKDRGVKLYEVFDKDSVDRAILEIINGVFSHHLHPISDSDVSEKQKAIRLGDMSDSLENSGDDIPDYIELGFCVWTLDNITPSSNAIDRAIISKWYDEYNRYLIKQEIQKHQPRNLTIKEASNNFEDVVQWCVERLRKQTYISISEAQQIADAFAVQNYLVTPGHVREAIRRISQTRK